MAKCAEIKTQPNINMERIDRGPLSQQMKENYNT